MLIAADGYRFGGKAFARRDEVVQIAQALPSLQQLVWLPVLGGGVPADLPDLPCRVQAWDALLAGPEVPRAAFRYARVDAAHPLWIVFSSGTTGLPKPIVHGHTGVLVEHLKLMHLHMDLRAGDVMFFYSTTGWMMWNLLVAALMTGAAAVLYDGSPVHGGPGCLWRLAADAGATSFGASPTYVQMMEKDGLEPGRHFDLARLRSVVLSGAPSTPETFDWFYRSVKRDLWVTSQSGGTELCSGTRRRRAAAAGACRRDPARMLGMAVEVWNDAGEPVVDEVGELVVTRPAPSMPIGFWNDADGARYRESYFEVFPGTRLPWRLHAPDAAGRLLHLRPLRFHSQPLRRAHRLGRDLSRGGRDGGGGRQPGGLLRAAGRAFLHALVPAAARRRAARRLLRARIAQRLRTLCSPRHVPDVMVAMARIPTP